MKYTTISWIASIWFPLPIFVASIATGSYISVFLCLLACVIGIPPTGRLMLKIANEEAKKKNEPLPSNSKVNGGIRLIFVIVMIMALGASGEETKKFLGMQRDAPKEPTNKIENKINAKTKKAINSLSNEINGGLPMNSIKTAEFKGGTAIILDEMFCYWVNEDGRVFCVNGASKSIIKECQNAPFDEGFLDIQKIVK